MTGELVALLVILAVACNKVEGLTRDGHILLEVKKGITLDPTNRLNSSWNESDDSPCLHWYGVTCTNFTPSGRVTELDLFFMGGTLSPALGGLDCLEVLDCAEGQFVGGIPPELGNLTSLLSLNLSSNAFVGQVPPEISRLRRLQFLRVDSNLLTGPLPDLWAFPDIVEVNTSNNRFSGHVPGLQGLQSLQWLDLSRNSLTGPIPNMSAGGMQALVFLDVSRNRLEGSVPMGPWRTVYLDLSDNQLTGSVPFQLVVAGGRGEYLNLSHNLLTGSLPEQLGPGGIKQDTLRSLDLSHNRLEGAVPGWMDSEVLPELTTLFLDHNRLGFGEAEGSSRLASLTGRLKELRLGSNRFGGKIRLSPNARAMEVLDLGHNTLEPEEPGGLLHSALSLYGNSLKELRLAESNLTGRLPSSLPTLPFLEVLDVSSNRLEGEIPLGFDNNCIPLLARLDLSDNRLQGRVPAHLFWFRGLAFVNLSNNNLSGPLPAVPPKLRDPALFSGNPGLCGDPLPACPPDLEPLLVVPPSAVPERRRSLLKSWEVFVGSAVAVAVLGAWFGGQMYCGRQTQDADLIAAVMQQKDRATLMPLHELRRATSNFATRCQIGEGGFGTVYAGTLGDGTRVAIKKGRLGCDMEKVQFLNEVVILCKVNHRHLVKLLGCCLERKVAVLVFEFVSNGTLQEHLQGARGERLGWSQRLQVATQTADALAYLHSAANPSIIHRDVKSSNILLDDNLNAKLADFGISKLAPVDSTHVYTALVKGTLGYIDPDYYTSSQITSKSDVYGFGVVLLELISAQAPVDLRRGHAASLVTFAVPLIQNGHLHQIVDPSLSSTYHSAAGRESIEKVASLAARCLNFQPRNRPTMKDLLKELHSARGLSAVTVDPQNDRMQELQQFWSMLGIDSAEFTEAQLNRMVTSQA